MKNLLAASAASMLIIAGTAYAGDKYYDDEYCDKCEDTVDITVLGTVDCVCEFSTDSLLFNVDMVTGHITPTQAFSVNCNGDDPEISVVSANGGLMGPGGTLVDYSLALTGGFATKTFAAGGSSPQTYEGNTQFHIELGTVAAALAAGDYSDTLTVTLSGQ